MICKMSERDSRPKDSKGDIQPWQRHKTLRKKHGIKWQLGNIKHQPSLMQQHGPPFPYPACWKGRSSFPVGVVNVCTLACAEQPEAWPLQHVSHSPALTALVSFCRQINSHFQLLLHAGTAERKEWSSSCGLMPHCSFQIPTACVVNVKLQD